MSTARALITNAKLIAICTLISRVTGLLRDMLLVHAFGLSWTLDAFNYGFQFPHLFRRFFGEGALAAVFVPTFTRSLESGDREAAWRLLARTLALLSVAVIAVILVIEVIIFALWRLDPTNANSTLILALTGLMLPFMLTICIVALLSSILNCVGSFVPAALAPLILNFGMIVGILWLAPLLGSEAEPERRIFGVAISVLVAGVIQLVLLAPVLRHKGVKLGWKWEPGNPQVRGMLKLMPPVLLGQGVLLFSTFLDAQICALLTRVADGPERFARFGLSFEFPLMEGALSAVTIAARLYQFPLGVIGISLAVAALPAFSRHAARADWASWTQELRGALRVALFTGLLSGALMVVLASPIVRMLFQYREFDAADTERAARVLSFYGFGMWAFFTHHIVLRGFYSLGDVRTPVIISCIAMPLNVTLTLILIWLPGIREAAFAISTSTTSAISVVIGLTLLKRRSPTPILGAGGFGAAARMLGCALGAAWLTGWLRASALGAFGDGLPAGIVPRAIETLGSLAVGCGLFLLIGWLLRLPEPAQVLHWRALRRELAGSGSRSTSDSSSSGGAGSGGADRG